MSEIDIYVLPPQAYPYSVARDIGVAVVTEQIVWIPNWDTDNTGPLWVSFMGSVDWYPIFQHDEATPAAIPDPDPTARGTATDQCWRVPANMELQRKIDITTNNFKVVALGDGVLRWHIASHK